MGIKKDIVIVNEFSIKTGTKTGTRGGTPGAYVTRYMSRKGATESLTPIRLTDNEQYIERYMLRDDAVEKSKDVFNLKSEIDDMDGYGGLSFGSFGKRKGYNSSFSDSDVKKISKFIQNGFDEHKKTVFKTVISFDEEFLKKNGLVDKDLVINKAGDYRGEVDQGRLRSAIINGMRKFGRHYDDLVWIGVVQFDTKHIHCHLCMMDNGKGRLYKDGTQIGKISDTARADLRRGIDLDLDLSQSIRHMSSQAVMDRRNAKCFIKKFTHKAFELNGAPQLIMAMLPDDKRLWRANTHNKEMKRADDITRAYVRQIFTYPESGYDKAVQKVYAYANARAERENLSDAEHRKLIKNGKQMIEDDCVNGVYSALKDINKRDKRVRTPLIDIAGMDMSDLANDHDDPIKDFGFKLRSYSSRLKHHTREKHKYMESKKVFENNPNVHSDALVLLRFYEAEEEYNRKLQSKYLYFLNFMPRKTDISGPLSELALLYKMKENLINMSNNEHMKTLTKEKAERYGEFVYGMKGGGLVVTKPSAIDNLIKSKNKDYERKRRKFSEILEDEGCILTKDHKVVKKAAYDFEDVKSLDLHHLQYDFHKDVPISNRNADLFKAETYNRYDKLKAAIDYLNESGQGEYVDDLPVKDVLAMKECADSLTGGNLESKILKNNGGSIKKRHTFTVDRSDVTEKLRQSVIQTINHIRDEEDYNL